MESDQEYSGFIIQAGARPHLKKKPWAARMWEQVRRQLAPEPRTCALRS